MVENLVHIELAYINTKHPDFYEANLIQKALTNGDFEKNLEKSSSQSPANATTLKNAMNNLSINSAQNPTNTSNLTAHQPFESAQNGFNFYQEPVIFSTTTIEFKALTVKFFIAKCASCTQTNIPGTKRL